MATVDEGVEQEDVGLGPDYGGLGQDDVGLGLKDVGLGLRGGVLSNCKTVAAVGVEGEGNLKGVAEIEDLNWLILEVPFPEN